MTAMASMRSLPLHELAEELDWVMPHLGDYFERDDKLQEYLGMKFGTRLMIEHVVNPQNIDMDGQVSALLDESENADAMFEIGDDGSPPLTALSLEDQNEDPPKITPVGYRAKHAIVVGPDCLRCSRPTTLLGLYRLEYGKIVIVHGTGPDKIPPGKVLEPSGELRLRLSYGCSAFVNNDYMARNNNLSTVIPRTVNTAERFERDKYECSSIAGYVTTNPIAIRGARPTPRGTQAGLHRRPRHPT